MRCEAQEHRALAARGAQPTNVAVLQVTNAAVYHLEAVSRGTGTEIAALDERDFQAAERRFARGGGACRSTADDEEVVFGSFELGKISMHRTFSAFGSGFPMYRASNVPGFIGENRLLTIFSIPRLRSRRQKARFLPGARTRLT
jgi:hypothetical protein